MDLLGPDVGRTEPGKSGDGLAGPRRARQHQHHARAVDEGGRKPLQLAQRRPRQLPEYRLLVAAPGQQRLAELRRYAARGRCDHRRRPGRWRAVVGLDSRPRRWIRAPARTSSPDRYVDLEEDQAVADLERRPCIPLSLARAQQCRRGRDRPGLGWTWGGGGKFYASFAVGILGDFVVWFSEPSNATDANSGAGSNGRWVTTSPVAKPTPTAPCSPGLGTPCSRRPRPRWAPSTTRATSCSVDGPTVASPVLSADPTLAGGGKPGAERQARAQWVSPRRRTA
jgi:hypothetical protein